MGREKQKTKERAETQMAVYIYTTNLIKIKENISTDVNIFIFDLEINIYASVFYKQHNDTTWQ